MSFSVTALRQLRSLDVVGASARSTLAAGRFRLAVLDFGGPEPGVRHGSLLSTHWQSASEPEAVLGPG